MDEPVPQRRLAENEAVFREFNKRVQLGIEEVNKIAKAEHDTSMHLGSHTLLHFYCECADEKCTKRIKMSPKMYRKIHEDNDTFALACGHEVPEIEYVIRTTPDYCVVRKYFEPPEHGAQINPTNLHNK
jgi:hypothetical protein